VGITRCLSKRTSTTEHLHSWEESLESLEHFVLICHVSKSIGLFFREIRAVKARLGISTRIPDESRDESQATVSSC
jgi:hypothetical protein